MLWDSFLGGREYFLYNLISINLCSLVAQQTLKGGTYLWLKSCLKSSGRNPWGYVRNFFYFKKGQQKPLSCKEVLTLARNTSLYLPFICWDEICQEQGGIYFLILKFFSSYNFFPHIKFFSLYKFFSSYNFFPHISFFPHIVFSSYKVFFLI